MPYSIETSVAVIAAATARFFARKSSLSVWSVSPMKTGAMMTTFASWVRDLSKKQPQMERDMAQKKGTDT